MYREPGFFTPNIPGPGIEPGSAACKANVLLLIICSRPPMHSTCGIYCFGGECAAASTILVVAIAKFGSYVKNRDKKQHV